MAKWKVTVSCFCVFLERKSVHWEAEHDPGSGKFQERRKCHVTTLLLQTCGIIKFPSSNNSFVHMHRLGDTLSFIQVLNLVTRGPCELLVMLGI